MNHSTAVGILVLVLSGAIAIAFSGRLLAGSLRALLRRSPLALAGVASSLSAPLLTLIAAAETWRVVRDDTASATLATTAVMLLGLVAIATGMQFRRIARERAARRPRAAVGH